jgi:hypothetical protein
MPIGLHKDLVAPCGINCGVCKRYLGTTTGIAQKKGLPTCIGCRPGNIKGNFIGGSCALRCELLGENKIDFCFECKNFPCQKLQILNHRYSTKYNTNLINNLLEIKKSGLDRWLEREEEKWKCPECGGLIAIHDRMCYSCGYQSSTD